MEKVSLFPMADYSFLKSRSEEIGAFRFFGKIEAIQGNNRIWVNDGNFTVAVILEDVSIFMLPSDTNVDSQGNMEHLLQNIEPTIVKWENLFSIPEGTRVFIGGSLYKENDRGIFKNDKKCSLMVVIYEGEKSSILNRAIWCGRQKNEYWNQFTLISLITGCFSLYILSFFLLQSSQLRLLAILAISLGVLPIAIFLPPGVILLFYFRRLWRQARLIRASRDLVMLPLRYIKNSKYFIEDKKKKIVLLPDNTEYIMHKGSLLENMNIIKNKDQINIRKCFQARNTKCMQDETYLFGAYFESSIGYFITKPDDPMAELVLIPGDPIKIADDCTKRAILISITAAGLLLVALGLNFFLVFFLLNLFV